MHRQRGDVLGRGTSRSGTSHRVALLVRFRQQLPVRWRVVAGLRSHCENSGDSPWQALEKLTTNTLRNKQGTGHGRPWLPSVTVEEARHATQVMGVVGDLLLRAMTKKLGQ